jgi:hypothetical protein
MTVQVNCRANVVPDYYRYWKDHELPSLFPQDYFALVYHARAALHRMRRRWALVTAFWKQGRLIDE